MVKSEGKKWVDLAEYVGWTGNILDLRIFTLLCLIIYKKVNLDAAQSTTEYYFDLDHEAVPSWRNYHVRGREIIKSLVIARFDEMDQDSLNETDMIEEIMNG